MHKVLTRLLFLLLLFWSSNASTQNCGFTISVPQDITICEESDVILNGQISGSYFGFEWTGTDGFFEDAVLNPTTNVSQTATYTLSVLSYPTTNLIVNGDFSGGNSNFTTDYTYVVDLPGSQTEMYPEGTYTVINNPNLVHNGFQPCTDHTGGGNMMVVNGAASLQEVWCQTITVMPNSTYIFQAFATSVNPSSPAILQFSINGTLLGSPFSLSGTTCVWEEFNQSWDSGVSTSVEICITNQNTAAGGNDFAIDDIFFGELCRDEEDFTVTLSTFDMLPPSAPVIDCNNPVTDLIVIPLPDIFGYQFAWSSFNGTIITNPNEQEITVLTGGEYSVTVTNADGCTLSQEYEVTADFEIPAVNIEGDLTLDCIQKSTTLSANSDSNILGINWTLPNFTEMSGFNINASIPGNYIAAAIGTNGCIGYDTVNVILESSQFVYRVDSAGALSCTIQEVGIFLDVTTTIDSIIWNGPDIISQNLNQDTIIVGEPGTYVYELFLGPDCSKKDSIFIEEIPASFSYLSAIPDTLNCNINDVDISIQNTDENVSIEWYFQNQLISNLDTANINNVGTYFAVLTDENGCTITDSVVVIGDFALPDYVVNIDSIDCIDNNGQFFSLTNSNLSYFWAGNGFTSTIQNPEFSKEGNYTLTVTGENGCQKTSVHFLPSSQSYPSVAYDEIPITCLNPIGSLNINSTIPTNIFWTDINGNTGSGNMITSTYANTYEIRAITNNGCEVVKTFSLTIDTISPILKPIAPALLTCNINSVSPDIQADLFNSFIWSGPGLADTSTLIPVFNQSGSYNLTLRRSNGCESSQTFIIFEDKTKPKFNAYAEDLSCKMPETLLNLTGNNNQTYVLLNTNQPIQNGYKITNPGIFTIKATNNLGCDSIISLDIKGNFEKPEINPKEIYLNCKLPSSWVSDQNFDPTLKYTWKTAQGLINADSILVTSNSLLELIAINSFGCESIMPVKIETDFNKPIIDISGNTVIKCTESNTTISLVTDTENPIIEWNLNNQIIGSSKSIVAGGAGDYIAKLTNPINGCSENKLVTISKQPPIESISLEINQPLCFGEQGNVIWKNTTGGSPPFLGLINTRSIFQNTAVSIPNGKYEIQITDSNGCKKTDEISINNIADFFVDAGKDTVINKGSQHRLGATSDIPWPELNNIKWNPSSTLSCDDCQNPIASPEEDTEYTVTIEDENGCIRSDKVVVRVRFLKGFTVPNIINPESTTGNQFFTILPLFNSIKTIRTLQIFDRWGNNVYSVKDIPAGDKQYSWDGTFNGSRLMPGVFVWVAEIEYLDNISEIVSGDVTIMK